MMKTNEFQKLVQHVIREVPNVDPFEATMVVMMVVFGPGSIATEGVDSFDVGGKKRIRIQKKLYRGSSSTPPSSHRDRMLQLLERFGCRTDQGGNIDRMREVTISYGCGTFRDGGQGPPEPPRRSGASTDPPRWDREWSGAVHGLAEGVHQRIKRSDAWLKRNVKKYKALRPDPEYLESDAEHLALKLIRPKKERTFNPRGEGRVEYGEEGMKLAFFSVRDTKDLPWGSEANWRGRTVMALPNGLYGTEIGDNVAIKTVGGQVTLEVTRGLEAVTFKLESNQKAKFTFPTEKVICFSQKGKDSEISLNRNEILCVTVEDDGMKFEITSAEHQIHVPPGAKEVFTVANGSMTFIFSGGRQQVLGAGEKGIFSCVTLPSGEEGVIIRNVHWKETLTGEEVAEIQISDGAILSLWECSCGTPHCQDRHRLEAWNPAGEDTLSTFVAFAVNGTAYPNIQTKSFVGGMYFSFLSKEGF